MTECVCANAVSLTVLTFHKLMEKSFLLFLIYRQQETGVVSQIAYFHTKYLIVFKNNWCTSGTLKTIEGGTMVTSHPQPLPCW